MTVNKLLTYYEVSRFLEGVDQTSYYHYVYLIESFDAIRHCKGSWIRSRQAIPVKKLVELMSIHPVSRRVAHSAITVSELVAR